MFAAILILLLLSITDISRSRGMQFRPLSKTTFFVFVSIFFILMQLGAKHVESPFIELGQVCTVLYFLYYTINTYCVTYFENTLLEVKYVAGPSTPKNEFKWTPFFIWDPSEKNDFNILQCVMLPEVVEIIETVVNNLPAADVVYDMARQQAADVVEYVSNWANNANEALDQAANQAQTASTEGLSNETVEACKNSASALVESGKAEIAETVEVAIELHNNNSDYR